LDLLEKQRPDALCNDCIASALGFSKRQQAYQVTSVLGLTRDYTRGDGVCARCQCKKLVTARLTEQCPASDQ